jgi:hypothetical protein
MYDSPAFGADSDSIVDRLEFDQIVANFKGPQTRKLLDQFC